MKTMSIREFGKKSNKNMNEAPLIITKGGKKAFVILPYSMTDKILNESDSFSVNSGTKELIGGFTKLEYNSGRETFKERIKRILLTKLF